MCSQDEISVAKPRYFTSYMLRSLPHLSHFSFGQMVLEGARLFVRVLTEFCVGDSFSLHLVEYFYLYNLGIPDIIV